jgi:protein NRD1
MTDVLPAVMNDLVQHAPDNQKEKITKLLDIWQRGQTFPSDMLANFKQQVNGGQRSKSLAVLFSSCLTRRCSSCCTGTEKPTKD